MMRLTCLALVALALLGGPAMADDPSIPQRCRGPDAYDDARCERILLDRFTARSARGSARDRAANLRLRDALMTSATRQGATVRQAIAQATRTGSFVPLGWKWAYGRSGARYAALEYGTEPGAKSDSLEPLFLGFDDDRDAEAVQWMARGLVTGHLVWKVEGDRLVPFGRLAAMLALGPEPFSFAVSEVDGRPPPPGMLGRIETGAGQLGSLVRLPTTNVILSWDGSGYGVLGDDGPCPARTFVDVTVSGKDCEARAEAARKLAGTVLPFRVHRAGKLRGVSGPGRVEAYASVAVTGGSMEDWLATGIYVAERAVIGEATFARVEVFLENPWGDAVPTRSKILAKVRFSPVPGGSPFAGTWSILGASHPTSIASIHFDILSNALLDPDLRPNPRRRGESAEAAATRIVRDLYGLPPNWEQPLSLGIRGPDRPRENIKVTVPPSAEASVGALRECLAEGCRPPRPPSGLEGIR